MCCFTKLIITAPIAHFKIPYSSKIQKTYQIPPLSTIIGILKNIYGDEIDNFKFGFTFYAKNKIFTDIQRIYKQASWKNRKQYRADGSQSNDICHVEYLINPKLIIYTDIDKEFVLEKTLNLGKTDCLAKLVVEKVELINKEGEGFNQWTSVNIGDGKILRIATETIYNKTKGIYDIKTGLFRMNVKFDYNKNYDENEGNIIIWNYKGGVLVEEIS